MATRIRLQRHGKKGKPFYWIVAADSRSKRDGRYLEKIGTYNPNTNPANVEINQESAINWLEKGAQPTDTARTLLSYKGILLKHHLNKGVKKGALTEDEADKKFELWLKEKDKKIKAKIDRLAKEKEEDKSKRLEQEKLVKEKRTEEAIAAKEKAELSKETPAAEETSKKEDTSATE